MITITRHQARQLRAVLRRSILEISSRGTIPPLVLRAEGTHLRAQFHQGTIAVEHVEAGRFEPAGSLVLPLEALADFEGRDDSLVVLESVAPDRTLVRWTDQNIPWTREYGVPPLDRFAPFPDLPAAWESSSPELLIALAEASETCTRDSARHALDCIQIRGSAGTIIASDGRQLLVRSGFGLPWDGDLLIKGSTIFACKALPRDQPIQVGKTDSHVVLQVGPWTIGNEI